MKQLKTKGFHFVDNKEQFQGFLRLVMTESHCADKKEGVQELPAPGRVPESGGGDAVFGRTRYVGKQ